MLMSIVRRLWSAATFLPAAVKPVPQSKNYLCGCNPLAFHCEHMGECLVKAAI